VSKFIIGLNSLLNFYKSKKSLPFILPIFIGVANKLNSIALIILPIQAIKSVSEGKLSNRSAEVFEILQIPFPANENIFIFFLILILSSLLTLIYLSKLKDNLIVSLKNKLKKNIDSKSQSLLKKGDNIGKLNKRINNFIKNSENLIFCLILSLTVIIYDFQIALIILFGCLLYVTIISDKNNNKNSNSDSKSYSIKTLSYFKILLQKFNNNDKAILKTTIATLVMLLIMSLLYLRTNSSISIIFIFLIRIFQNNLLTSITNLFNKNELPF
jgi:hypothetical protein